VSQGTTYDGLISQTNVVHLQANRTLVYGCNSDSATTQQVPLSVSIREVNGVSSRTGSPYTLPGPRSLQRLMP
jgi:hypothetical protein